MLCKRRYKNVHCPHMAIYNNYCKQHEAERRADHEEYHNLFDDAKNYKSYILNQNNNEIHNNNNNNQHRNNQYSRMIENVIGARVMYSKKYGMRTDWGHFYFIMTLFSELEENYIIKDVKHNEDHPDWVPYSDKCNTILCSSPIEADNTNDDLPYIKNVRRFLKPHLWKDFYCKKHLYFVHSEYLELENKLANIRKLYIDIFKVDLELFKKEITTFIRDYISFMFRRNIYLNIEAVNFFGHLSQLSYRNFEQVQRDYQEKLYLELTINWYRSPKLSAYM